MPYICHIYAIYATHMLPISICSMGKCTISCSHHLGGAGGFQQGGLATTPTDFETAKNSEWFFF